MSEIISKILELDKMEGNHGWIQWKGTNVCMDLHCECGHMGHVDVDFFYYFKCPSCQKIYAVGQNVRLYPVSKEEIKDVYERLIHTCELEE